jgi:hypothetical protein
MYVLVILFALPTQNFDHYYFQEPLSISFEKTSLALAALRDTQESEEHPALVFNTLASESLSSPRLRQQVAKYVPVGPRLVVFEEGVTVSKTEIMMVRRQLDKNEALAKLSAKLSPQQMNRLMMTSDVDQILFEDWSQPNFSEEVDKFIAEEQAAIEQDLEQTAVVKDDSGPFNQLALELANQTQPTVIVSSGKIIDIPKAQDTFVPGNLIAKNDYAPPPDNPKYHDSMKGFSGTGDSVVPKSQVLKGTFEFTQGMGFLFGQQELQILHEIEGVIYNKGFINWTSATFEIPVNMLAGEIRAVIVDKEGFVVGQGEIPLEGLPSDSYELSGFHIPLVPKYNGLVVNTISAYSFDEYIEKAPNVRIGDPYEKTIYSSDGDGRLENKLIKNGSTQTLQFKGKGNWTTTNYIEAGERSVVPVFEDSMVNALLETLREQGYNKGLVGNHGIIWGKIKNYKNAEGIQVKITDKDAFGPAYLNHVYLPQSNLFATTKNGYFIFAGVNPGVHSLSFEYQGKTFQRTIETFRQNITYMDVELDNVIEQKVAFVNHEEAPNKDIEVYIPGAKLAVAPSNPMKVKTVKSSAYNFLEFKERGSDVVYRANIPSTERQVVLKYLDQQKLLRTLNWNGISNAILGFVNPQEFSGLFLNKAELTTNQMVYFDNDIKIIPNEQLAMRWTQIAGFIIYNVPEGSQSLQIFDEKGYVMQQEILIGNKIIHIIPEWN